MDLCDLAGIVAVPRQRHETRMGFCLALAHGCGNLRDHSNRVRSRPPLALWPRAQRHGSSYWHHAGDHFHRFARRQDSFLAVGTFSPPALGNRAHVKVISGRRASESPRYARVWLVTETRIEPRQRISRILSIFGRKIILVTADLAATHFE